MGAIELVTATGEAITVDADQGEDLFWTLRGGGGDYAIVTALHLDLVRAPIAVPYEKPRYASLSSPSASRTRSMSRATLSVPRCGSSYGYLLAHWAANAADA